MPKNKVKYSEPARLSRYRPPLSSRRGKPPKVADQLGARIRHLRMELKLTQEEVADAVGVTKAAVSQWESGSCDNIKLNNFRELLIVLNTDWDYLIFGTTAKAETTAE